MSYTKIWINLFVVITATIFGFIIYGAFTSQKVSDITASLQNVHPDSLSSISIYPINRFYNINLTNDTVVIYSSSMMKSLLHPLKSIGDGYHHRVIRDKWDTFVSINYKSGKVIKLKITDTNKGICVQYLSTMGNPKYLVNDIREPLIKASKR